MPEIRNAQITNTFLGFEDHGIFTFNLFVEGNGWGCSYGNFVLSGKNPKTGNAGYSRTGIEAIACILKTLDIDSWENLKGQFIRIKTDGRTISAIGNLVKDKWFSYKEFYKEHEDED